MLIGVDGYRRGWVGACLIGSDLSADAIAWRTAAVDGIGAMLADAVVAAVDMPIGLVERGWRDCDRAAKAELGAASSRVFMTPPREVLELGLAVPNDTVQRVSRELTGQGVSRQALGLATRVLALDAALDVLPRPEQVVEVHPELSFAQMAGRVLPSKKAADGQQARCEVLRDIRRDLDDVLAQRPADVPQEDALDALAALWTAVRWSAGQARTLPPAARLAPFIAV